MHRITYLLTVITLAVLVKASYDTCKRCNVSYMVTKRAPRTAAQYLYNPRIHGPLENQVSYLSEDNYAEEQEPIQTEEQSLNRDNRNSLPEYRDLCEIITKKVQLDDSEYEYLPPHYHEVYCKNYPFYGNEQATVNLKQECVNPGFHCVQRSKTLFLVRRRWDSECWEPFVKKIASGCDCMWPVSVLGDISGHY